LTKTTTVEWKGTLAPDEQFVAMTQFAGKLFIASNLHVYTLEGRHKDRLTRVPLTVS
jgi:hypothetical protein